MKKTSLGFLSGEVETSSVLEDNILPFGAQRVFSSGGERFLHTEEATGSIPVTPTTLGPA